MDGPDGAVAEAGWRWAFLVGQSCYICECVWWLVGRFSECRHQAQTRRDATAVCVSGRLSLSCQCLMEGMSLSLELLGSLFLPSRLMFHDASGMTRRCLTESVDLIQSNRE
eukprot:scaffold20387_cov47-Attheya_sp.AAC.1